MRTLFLGFIFWGLCGHLLMAQLPNKALRIFLESDFIIEFDQFADKAEHSVRTFKFQEAEYKAEEIAEVKKAYDASARKFNQTLLNIKRDLLDKDRRNILLKVPDAYAKQVELDLYKAKDFYANTYLVELGRFSEVDSFGFLRQIEQLINFVNHAIGLFHKIRGEFNQYNEQVIDQYLIDDHRFKYWEEIQ